MARLQHVAATFPPGGEPAIRRFYGDVLGLAEMPVPDEVADQIAGLKTFLEHVTLKDVLRSLKVQLASLERLKARLLAQVLQALKAHEDLAARFRLLLSIPGFGPVVAASLAIRMPELGQMRRGQAAALAGVAPFDRDSGQWKGLRFITGGRARVRRMLYLASLAAKRYDPGFKAFHQALLARGKPIKLAIVEREPGVDPRRVRFFKRVGFERESLNLSYVRSAA